ncbi:hypothetical protein [uncultured Tenacibaculum sp.]|uniref:hypothetical protein n=1 Tax=uncultured Tenacibaculum sp. TaxID=174713 RepID=UPI0026383EC0|nr:hypothetical protein [uncultured Tenacibaculum sp.]
MKYVKGIGIIVLLLVLVNFTFLQTMQEDEELIIGKWIPEGCPKCELVFTEDGKCYDYYEGKLDNTYTYFIYEETSDNGKLKFSTLKKININDPSDTYEYDINGLNEKVMYLDYQRDMNCNLLKYTRK